MRKGVAGRRASGHLGWAARRKGQPEEAGAGPRPRHLPPPRPQLADAVAVVTVGSPGCQTPPQLRHRGLGGPRGRAGAERGPESDGAGAGSKACPVSTVSHPT